MCRNSVKAFVLLFAVLFSLLITSLEQIDCPKMSGSQRPSRVPTRRSTALKYDNDHSYVKNTQKGTQKGKIKNISSQNDDINVDNSCDESDDSVSLLNENPAPCNGCKKTLSKTENGVCCNFCEHWFCLKCSKLKRMVYQALKDSPDSLMWFCSNCLTAFPGVKKFMIRMGTLEDKFDKLEQRVENLEKQPSTIENVKDIVREEVREIRDIESRRLHMICFNLPESSDEDPDQRKNDDETNLKGLIDTDMNLRDQNIEVENPVRLGKRTHNPHNETDDMSSKVTRPLRFKVQNFEDKRKILQGNTQLKRNADEKISKIYLTPDLTKKQREDSFKLREELRYRSRVLEEKNLRISRGRIVTVGDTDSNSSSWNRYKGPRVFNSRTIGGSGPSVEREGPPGVRPFLNSQ